jgi:parallel beta-helix repeat protein
MYPCSDSAEWGKYNTYRDIYAYDNGVIGFADRFGTSSPASSEDTHNVYDNIQSWDNGTFGIYIAYENGIVLSNSDATGNGSVGGFVFGIYFLDVKDSSISNCSATSNDVYGIGLTGSKNININDCFSTLNGGDGIYIEESSDGINLTNVIVKNNGTGIHLETCSNIRLTSCQSYDDRETPLQDYGLKLSGTNTGISLLNCKLTSNKEGEIYNPAGAVLTVITEKVSPSVIVR